MEFCYKVNQITSQVDDKEKSIETTEKLFIIDGNKLKQFLLKTAGNSEIINSN
jgi:hypothetical protein